MAGDNGTDIKLNDKATATLNRIINVTNRMINAFSVADATVNNFADTSEATSHAVDAANQHTVNSTASAANDIVDSTKSMQKGFDNVDGLDVTALSDQVDQVLAKANDLNDLFQPIDVSRISDSRPFAPIAVDSDGSELAKLAQNLSQIDDVEVGVIPKVAPFEMPEMPPVELPIEWQSVEQLDVFKSSGIDRFGQELSSVHSLMDRTVSAQSEVNSALEGMNVPDNMQEDLTALNSRILDLQSAISEIESNPVDDIVADGVNSQLENLRGQLLDIIETQSKMTNGLNDMDISSANAQYASLVGQIDRADKHIRDNINTQHQFTQSVDESSASVGRLAAAFSLAQVGAKALVKITQMIGQSISGAISRFDTMNTFPVMMEHMGYSAEQAQASINRLSSGIDGLPTTLDSVVATAQQLALTTGDLGRATELTLALNNAFLASGASSSDASRGLQQFSQMLAKGKVDAQSWTTLQETMPMALKKTAEAFGHTGQSATTDFYGALQKGEITFSEFSSKLIELSNEVGGFADLALVNSVGIATSMQNIRTAFVKGTTDVIGAIDTLLVKLTGSGIAEWLNRFKDLVSSVFKTVTNAITVAGEILVPIFDALNSGINYVNQALSWLGTQLAWLSPLLSGLIPIFTVIVSLLALYYAQIMLVAAGKAIVTAAQWAWNAAIVVYNALMGSALTRTIALLIVVIGVLYLGVAMWNAFTGAAVSATGIIVGAVYWLGAVILNVLIAITNVVLGSVHFIVNLFQAGLYLVQLAWFGLQMLVAMVLFAILAVVQGVVNLVGQIFMAGLHLINLLWHGLKMAVVLILFGILFATQSAVNGMGEAWIWGVNLWNQAWFDFRMYVGNMLVGMLDGVSGFINSAVDGFNHLKYQAGLVWYNIASAAGNMATAIAQGIDGMINSVISGIEGMLNSVLSGINDMIAALDKIPGVNIGSIGSVSLSRSNMAGGVSSFTSGLAAPTAPSGTGSNIQLGDGLKGSLANMEAPPALTWNNKDFTSSLQDWILGQSAPEAGKWSNIDIISGLQNWIGNQSAPDAPEQWNPDWYLDFKDLGEAWEQGYELGEGFEGSIGDFLGGLEDLLQATEGNDLSSLFDGTPGADAEGTPENGGSGGGGGNPTGGKLDSIGEIEDEVEIDEQVLKLIRDVAKMKWQQNFITLSPEVTNHVEITTDQEYEDFIAKFNDDILDAVENSADGL